MPPVGSSLSSVHLVCSSTVRTLDIYETYALGKGLARFPVGSLNIPSSPHHFFLFYAKPKVPPQKATLSNCAELPPPPPPPHHFYQASIAASTESFLLIVEALHVFTRRLVVIASDTSIPPVSLPLCPPASTSPPTSDVFCCVASSIHLLVYSLESHQLISHHLLSPPLQCLASMVTCLPSCATIPSYRLRFISSVLDPSPTTPSHDSASALSPSITPSLDASVDLTADILGDEAGRAGYLYIAIELIPLEQSVSVHCSSRPAFSSAGGLTVSDVINPSPSVDHSPSIPLLSAREIGLVNLTARSTRCGNCESFCYHVPSDSMSAREPKGMCGLSCVPTSVRGGNSGKSMVFACDLSSNQVLSWLPLDVCSVAITANSARGASPNYLARGRRATGQNSSLIVGHTDGTVSMWRPPFLQHETDTEVDGGTAGDGHTRESLGLLSIFPAKTYYGAAQGCSRAQLPNEEVKDITSQLRESLLKNIRLSFPPTPGTESSNEESGKWLVPYTPVVHRRLTTLSMLEWLQTEAASGEGSQNSSSDSQVVAFETAEELGETAENTQGSSGWEGRRNERTAGIGGGQKELTMFEDSNGNSCMVVEAPELALDDTEGYLFSDRTSSPNLGATHQRDTSEDIAHIEEEAERRARIVEATYDEVHSFEAYLGRWQTEGIRDQLKGQEEKKHNAETARHEKRKKAR
eukprot:GHVS01067436.1.p1 GENE.GHVS01067436.1~~GHVS01067436.1.p1  ORF type:complete len:794 (-),score=119.73 GHVS01067436.1:435-2516(-)